jgi:hypothetical protein
MPAEPEPDRQEGCQDRKVLKFDMVREQRIHTVLLSRQAAAKRARAPANTPHNRTKPHMRISSSGNIWWNISIISSFW